MIYLNFLKIYQYFAFSAISNWIQNHSAKLFIYYIFSSWHQGLKTPNPPTTHFLKMYTSTEPFTTPIICAKIHCMAWLPDPDGGGLLATGKFIIIAFTIS